MRRDLWLDNPPVNVITRAMCEKLLDQLYERDTRVLVLRGKGKCFSAGVDVKEHLPGEIEKTLPAFHRLVTALYNFASPTVSVIHGYALGGGLELCLATDLVFAAEDALLGFPEISLGVFAPVAAANLQRIIGPHRASELLFTGKRITAATAREWGLVNAVFPAKDLDRGVDDAVAQIAAHPLSALRACKKAMRAGAEFTRGIQIAEPIYLNEATTDEAIRLMRAFLKK